MELSGCGRRLENVFRRMVRRIVPLALRIRVRAARRDFRDRRAAVVFSRADTTTIDFPYLWAEYRRDFIDYPGQEHLAQAKRRNQSILASYLDGVVVQPRETYSVWRLAPKPSRRQGYAAAAALKGGELVQEVGGAICLLSTALYNAALLSGMDIVERWCHSVDSYGEARYFQLGRDAAIEFAYRDLRFRNPHDHPVLVRVLVDEKGVSAAVHSPLPRPFDVGFTIQPSEVPFRACSDDLAVHTERVTIWADGRRICDDLGLSVYKSVPPNNA